MDDCVSGCNELACVRRLLELADRQPYPGCAKLVRALGFEGRELASRRYHIEPKSVCLQRQTRTDEPSRACNHYSRIAHRLRSARDPLRAVMGLCCVERSCCACVMPSQDLFRAFDLIGCSLCGPTETLRHFSRGSLERRAARVLARGEIGSTQDDVVELDGHLVLDRIGDLAQQRGAADER